MADLNNVLVDVEYEMVLSPCAAQTLYSRESLFQESLGKQNVYVVQSTYLLSRLLLLQHAKLPSQHWPHYCHFLYSLP